MSQPSEILEDYLLADPAIQKELLQWVRRYLKQHFMRILQELAFQQVKTGSLKSISVYEVEQTLWERLGVRLYNLSGGVQLRAPTLEDISGRGKTKC